jgi:hypothetical protein
MPFLRGWVTVHSGDMGYGFLRKAEMPRKECNPVDERLKFIARLLDGEKMAGLACVRCDSHWRKTAL